MMTTNYRPQDALADALALLNVLQYFAANVPPNQEVSVNAEDMATTLYLVIQILRTIQAKQ